MKKECEVKFPDSNLTVTGYNNKEIWVNTPEVMNQVVPLSELPRSSRFMNHGGAFNDEIGDNDHREIGAEIRTFMDKAGKPRITTTMTTEVKLTKSYVIEGKIFKEGERIEILKERLINFDYQKEFVIDNISIASEFDLQDLYTSLFQRKFFKDTGTSITKPRSSTNWEIPNLGFKADESLSYEEILAQFNTLAGGIDPEERWRKEHMSYMNKSIFGQDRPGVYSVSEYGYGIKSLLQLIDYVVNGEKEKDFAKYNAWIDRYGMNNIMEPTFDVDVPELGPGVHLKKFKNGRVKVTGVSPRDLDEMNRVLDSLR